MNLLVYRSTGVMITAVRRLFRVDMRVSGQEHIPDRPVLFVVNHFTRFETFLVPYVIHHAVHRPVHSLGTDSLFRGVFARFFSAAGVMSIRDPRRNRTIVRGLMTRESDWVIYPEGGLVKSRRIVRRGKLWVHRPERSGPPHTGGAVLALKAEIAKRRCRDAWRCGDQRRIGHYRDAYGIEDPRTLADQGVAIVPVTITYHNVRPRDTLLVRAARALARNLHPSLDEELVVESSILFGGGEISIHFGEAIDVAAHLDRPTSALRALLGRRDESRQELLLARQARHLTRQAMRAIYAGTEIGFDHLFCYALRSLDRDVVPRAELHQALFTAALELRGIPGVRLHPVLRNGITSLVTGRPFAPLEGAVSEAIRQGVLRVDGDAYVIDRAALEEELDDDRVRLDRFVQIPANEIEPLEDVTAAIRGAVRSRGRGGRALAKVIIETDRRQFERDHASWRNDGARPAEMGRPFRLDARDAAIGVVLVHGYLSSPEQIRDLGRHLHRAAGASVYAPCLPGHGTSAAHLELVTGEDWFESVTRAVVAMRQRCDRVVVAGLSLGGILALEVAARHPDLADGVVAMNACLRLNDRRIAVVPFLDRWDRLRARARGGDAFRRLANDSEMPEVNYAEHSVRGARELYATMRRTRRILADVRAPALVLQATADPIVDPASGPALLEALGSADKALVTFELDRHIISVGAGSEAVFACVERFVRRLAAPDRIASFDPDARTGPTSKL